MKKRILIIGKKMELLEDMQRHLQRSYYVQICGYSYNAISEQLKNKNVDVILFYLDDPIKEQLFGISELVKEKGPGSIPVCIIGKENECDLYLRTVSKKPKRILVRPVPMRLLYDQVEEVIRESEMHMRKAENKEKLVMQKKLDKKASQPLVKKEEAVKEEADNTPVKQKEASVPAARLQKEKHELNTDMAKEKQKKVLIVDDDIRVIRLVHRYLSPFYEVVGVTNGKEALNFLMRKSADIVLCDYMMPEMDGVETLRRIRQEKFSKDIPVIFLTSMSDKDKVMECLKMDLQGYILKPVAPEILISSIEKILHEAEER